MIEGPLRAPSSPPETPVPIKRKPFELEIAGTADRVLVVGVAAVDDDVARLQVWDQQFDEVINRRAGLDHQHHPTRTLQQARQLLDRVGADDVRALRLIDEKLVYLGHGAVVDGHDEAVVVHIENQVLAHHGEADEADVGRGGGHG